MGLCRFRCSRHPSFVQYNARFLWQSNTDSYVNSDPMLVCAAHSEKTRYRQPQTSAAQISRPCDNAYNDDARFPGPS